MIFLPYNIAAFTAGSTLTVIGEDHNHIANSLRAKIGEHFIVGDNDGHELSCTIAQITKREVVFSVDAPFIRQNCASNELILVFALLKGDKNEEILKRCTEIGVSMGTCKALTGSSKTKILLVIRGKFFQEIYIDKHPVPTVSMRENILASHIVTGKKQQIL